MTETMAKIIRALSIVFLTVILLWSVYFAYRLGRIEGELLCQLEMMENVLPELDSAPPDQEIKFPTDSELFENFIQCRKDLTELAEATNTNINCHDRTCSRE